MTTETTWREHDGIQPWQVCRDCGLTTGEVTIECLSDVTAEAVGRALYDVCEDVQDDVYVGAITDDDDGFRATWRVEVTR